MSAEKTGERSLIRTAFPGILLVAAALVIVVLAVRLPHTVRAQSAESSSAAGSVLDPSAIPPIPAGAILHVVATTQVKSPDPMPPKPKKQPKESEARNAVWIGRMGGVICQTITRTESDHWIDADGERRHSTISSAWDVPEKQGGRSELLEADGSRTIVVSTKSSHESTWTDVNVTDADDWATDNNPELADPEDQSPEQRIMGTADPMMYRSLVVSGTLEVRDRGLGSLLRIRARSTLLRSAETRGTGVDHYRIDIGMYRDGGNREMTATLIADLRQADLVPVQVKGHFSSQSWVTDYQVVEWLPTDKVPLNAFRISIPEGARVHVNRSASSVATTSSPAPGDIWWLGSRFDGLRSTGKTRLVKNTTDYQVMLEPGSAPVMADEGRPRLSDQQVIAEYTPDGKPGNMTRNLTENTLKVITMPHTGSSTWEKKFAIAASMMPGDSHTPDWVMQTEWTRVRGTRALRLHHGFTFGDGTTTGRIHPTFDYLVFDLGDSTVMIQGACSKPGQVERAAEALISAK